MAADQFLTDLIQHILQLEQPFLPGDLSMEDHLHHHIPQFLPKVRCVLMVDGVHRLIDLFEKIVPDAFVGLFPVPGTTLRRTEDRHDLHQIFKAIAIFWIKIYHIMPSFASIIS